MFPHSGFQFWNKSEDHRDSMSIWFSLRTTSGYVKICPSKCQAPSPCSFALQAVRRSHFALHCAEPRNPTKQRPFSTDSSPTHTQSSRQGLMCDLNTNELPQLGWACCATSASRGCSSRGNSSLCPGSQPALSVPWGQQERTTQQERTHTHPQPPQHLPEREEFTSPTGNSFCSSFLGQGPKLWPREELTLQVKNWHHPADVQEANYDIPLARTRIHLLYSPGRINSECSGV